MKALMNGKLYLIILLAAVLFMVNTATGDDHSNVSIQGI